MLCHDRQEREMQLLRQNNRVRHKYSVQMIHFLNASFYILLAVIRHLPTVLFRVFSLQLLFLVRLLFFVFMNLKISILCDLFRVFRFENYSPK